MSAVVIPFPAFVPDRQAQQLYLDLSAASDRLNDLLDDLPGQTVSGEETREELRIAMKLMETAETLLRGTLEREMPKWERSGLGEA